MSMTTVLKKLSPVIVDKLKGKIKSVTYPNLTETNRQHPDNCITRLKDKNTHCTVGKGSLGEKHTSKRIALTNGN